MARKRAQLVNMVRGMVRAFGVTLPNGIPHAPEFARWIVAGEPHEVLMFAASVIKALARQARERQTRIRHLERELLTLYSGATSAAWSPPRRASAFSEPPPWPQR